MSTIAFTIFVTVNGCSIDKQNTEFFTQYESKLTLQTTYTYNDSGLCDASLVPRQSESVPGRYEYTFVQRGENYEYSAYDENNINDIGSTQFQLVTIEKNTDNGSCAGLCASPKLIFHFNGKSEEQGSFLAILTVEQYNNLPLLTSQCFQEVSAKS